MRVHWNGSSFEVPLIVGFLIIGASLLVVFLIACISYKEMEKTIYACGECGCRFRAKWFRFFTSHKLNDVFLKCPRCKKKSMCSPSYDQSIEPDIDETK